MKKRNHTRTTIAGILAALGTALQAAQLLPPPLNLIPIVLTVVGQALLGHSAADKRHVEEKP